MELRQFKHKNVKHPNIPSHPFGRPRDTYIYGLYSEESGRVCIDANGLDSTHTWILTLSIESQDCHQIKLKVTTQ